MTHPQRYLGVAVKRVTIVAGLSVTRHFFCPGVTNELKKYDAY